MKGSNAAGWYGPGSELVIQGYIIPDALLYVGDRLGSPAGYENDHCLVRPSLPIQFEGSDEIGSMPSSPHYTHISPLCRGVYLRWLSEGRSRSMTDIGYALLFVYGLERRLFVDGPKGLLTADERGIIVDEVHSLRATYGGHATFLDKTDNLIAMEWLLYRRNTQPPACFSITDRYSIDVVQIKLAYYIAREKAVHAELAYQIVKAEHGSGLRAPSRRCPQYFRELFLLRYREQYGNGIALRPYKSVRKLRYHAANPSLHDALEFHVEGLSCPLYRNDITHKLNALALRCSTELDEFSRYFSQKNAVPHGLHHTGLLPFELLQRTTGWKLLKSLLTNGGDASPAWYPIDELYACFDQRPPSELKPRECVVMAKTIGSMGFSMVPDVRIHAMLPVADSRIAVFPFHLDAKRSASKMFRMIALTIQLVCTVFRNDGSVQPAGERYLKSMIDRAATLPSREKASLRAFLEYCLRTGQSIAGLKQRLRDLSAAEKRVISNRMFSAASAIGCTGSGERRQLEKMRATLGLREKAVMRDPNTCGADAAPVTVSRREIEASFAIPPPPDSGQALPVGFTLRQGLIRVFEEETRRVRVVLESIFADESCSRPDMDGMSRQRNDTVDPSDALDEQHRRLLRVLLEKERWEHEHVDDVCDRLGLMKDGAMETLNEWAYTQANAPLLETGDHVCINLDLAKEIQDVR
jgi:hypothetical protein